MKTWKHFVSAFYPTDFDDVFFITGFPCLLLPSPIWNFYLALLLYLAPVAVQNLHLLYLRHWSMAKNTQTVKTSRMSSCPTLYLNSVARKAVTLLKTSFCYTFLYTKSFISLHLLYLRHWSMAKNTQTVKTNRMSSYPTPYLNLVARGLLNGTRSIVSKMLDNYLQLTVITGAKTGSQAIIFLFLTPPFHFHLKRDNSLFI